MFAQLTTCVCVCGSVLQRGHSGDGCLTSSILFKYERGRGHLFVLSWAMVRRVARESTVSGMVFVTTGGWSRWNSSMFVV